MTGLAKGNFEVQVQPTGSFGGGIGRLAVTKTFRGDIEGTGEGEMLAIRTDVPGSAGYVLIERLTISLGDLHGSFVLQHFGLMEGGTPEARIVVVPNSGTGALQGITGEMTIDPANDHSYVFSHALPDRVSSGRD